MQQTRGLLKQYLSILLLNMQILWLYSNLSDPFNHSITSSFSVHRPKCKLLPSSLSVTNILLVFDTYAIEWNGLLGLTDGLLGITDGLLGLTGSLSQNQLHSLSHTHTRILSTATVRNSCPSWNERYRFSGQTGWDIRIQFILMNISCRSPQTRETAASELYSPLCHC